MGSGSAYNYIAMKEAVKDSGLEEKDVSNISTGMLWVQEWTFNRKCYFSCR